MTLRPRQYGDFQTPPALAEAIAARLGHLQPATIVEPTCGLGHFLSASAVVFPEARRLGFEIHPPYVEVARRSGAEVRLVDFFAVDWEAEAARWAEPILVLGNPPWVTNAAQGRIGAANLPVKHNREGVRGIEALTGRSNFDIAEWMIRRLLQALSGRDAVVAMLCKTAVARRILADAASAPVGLWRIDAKRHFHAAVDAGLFAIRADGASAGCPVYADLHASTPDRTMGIADGRLMADLDAYRRTAHLAGDCPDWRSGIKHDCARVLELRRRGTDWINAAGDPVDVEDEVLYPLMKSSDLANDRPPTRALVVPQRRLDDDPARLQSAAPRAWAYLRAHGEALDARKSRIYLNRPRFSIFGVGDYSFAPWKVAISGLYRRLTFRLVGPHDGRPVLFDDTCYLLPFADEAQARAAWERLSGPEAADFFHARIWWDAKRPITKGLLRAFAVS